jgi:hypothetical protein
MIISDDPGGSLKPLLLDELVLVEEDVDPVLLLVEDTELDEVEAEDDVLATEDVRVVVEELVDGEVVEMVVACTPRNVKYEIPPANRAMTTTKARTTLEAIPSRESLLSLMLSTIKPPGKI